MITIAKFGDSVVRIILGRFTKRIINHLAKNLLFLKRNTHIFGVYLKFPVKTKELWQEKMTLLAEQR